MNVGSARRLAAHPVTIGDRIADFLSMALVSVIGVVVMGLVVYGVSATALAIYNA